MNIAVIPARGGSKRIPKKNIRNFSGLPIISYPILTAINSGLFEHVIVSTDDEEISKIAIKYGAEVPFKRPGSLSDDYVGITKVLAHAVDWMKKNGWDPTSICCISPTAPFVMIDDIKKALVKFKSGDWDYVFSATTYPYPIKRSFYFNENRNLTMLFPEHFDSRSQDLSETLHDAGQFYWGKPEAWHKCKRIFDKNSDCIILPSWRVHDIDTENDWKMAEILSSRIFS